MRAATRERMISIMALVLVISGFVVPKAAAQSDKYSKMRWVVVSAAATGKLFSRTCAALSKPNTSIRSLMVWTGMLKSKPERGLQVQPSQRPHHLRLRELLHRLTHAARFPRAFASPANARFGWVSVQRRWAPAEAGGCGDGASKPRGINPRATRLWCLV